MLKLKKVLSVFMASALIMGTALPSGIPVLAEEAAEAQAAETATEENPEASGEEEEKPAGEENPEEDGKENEDAVDESAEPSGSDAEVPESDQQEEPDGSDDQEETGESDQQDDADSDSQEVSPEEDENQPDDPEDEEQPDNAEAEDPESKEETKDEEPSFEIIKGIQLNLNEYSEEELAALPLSALLKHLQDGDGNFIDIAEDAAAVWIRIKDSAGSVLFDGQYGRTSEETLDFSQYVNAEGYVVEVTVGSGEREDPGNKQYVAALDVDARLTSLLPLEEVRAKLILNAFSEKQLKSMPLRRVLNNLQDMEGNKIKFPEGATTVWSYYKDENGSVLKDEYHAIESDDKVDLTSFWDRTTYSMELIVGSGQQLDPGNIRYIVEVYISDEVEDYISFQLYVQDENGTRTRVTPLKGKSYSFVNRDYNEKERGFDVTHYVVPAGNGESKYFLTMRSDRADEPYWDVDVYDYASYLSFQSGNQEAPAITDQIFDSGTGYEGNFVSPQGTFDRNRNLFVLVYKNPQTGAVYGTKSVGFVVTEDIYSVSGNLYAYENGKMVEATRDKDFFSNVNMIDFETGSMMSENGAYFYLKDGYYLTGEYYCTLDVESVVSGNVDSSVKQAVKGFYNSWAEAKAAGQKNIKNKLILADSSQEPSGYKIDLSNYSVPFTLFMDNGSVLKVTVYGSGEISAEAASVSRAPVVGKVDPWFQIRAVEQDGEKLPIYAVENNGSKTLDTMYGYGYQTVFVDSEADLTRVKLSYWVYDEDKGTNRVFFANEDGTAGAPVEKGKTEIDFSRGPVQFIVAISGEDSQNYQKNYVIELKKRDSGPKLYVYGPRTREVFLDQYFEYKHDILIANLGNEPLTGLKVKLEATNCSLDDYWTVGGEKNDTLAPFTTTKKSGDAYHGELANMAKITLRPDVDEYSKDGEIKGTLTISADNQEPVVITLTGTAQNPKITTQTLPDGVKYVPYSCIITTNNMHDWLDVAFELKGDLPNGVEWYPETGEIYGVPRETGEFPIQITAKFTPENLHFESSTAELTLTVLDNTNGNVYAASDEGYTVLDAIGEDMGDLDFVVTELGDETFRSSGELGEFMDLWLNGVKLTEGVDYSAESGSTVITVWRQTFDDKVDRTGRNTLAAEFRVAGERTNELKRTAQNFRLELAPSVTPTPEFTVTPEPTMAPQQPTATPKPTQPTSTPVPMDYVNCAVHLIDGDGNPLVTRSLEMHSDPVNSTTDVNGLAGFGHVEFGGHTVFVKDSAGNVEASKAFTLQEGAGPSLAGDVITASLGSSITIEMKLANGALSIEAVQNGITSKSSPATGDESTPGLWLLLLLASLGTMTVLGVRRVRR